MIETGLVRTTSESEKTTRTLLEYLNNGYQIISAVPVRDGVEYIIQLVGDSK